MLNYEEIKKDLQRITKIKNCINKYNWEEIHFPSKKDDSKKKIEKNNVTIEEIYLILLMFQIISQIVKNKLFF